MAVPSHKFFQRHRLVLSQRWDFFADSVGVFPSLGFHQRHRLTKFIAWDGAKLILPAVTHGTTYGQKNRHYTLYIIYRTDFEC